MTPQAELLREVEPSVFALIQLIKGGCHMTSLITGAIGG